MSRIMNIVNKRSGVEPSGRNVTKEHLADRYNRSIEGEAMKLPTAFLRPDIIAGHDQRR